MTTLIEFLRDEEEKYFTTEEEGRVVTYIKSPRKREGGIPYEVVFRIQEATLTSPFTESSELFALLIRNQIITLKTEFLLQGEAGVFTFDGQMNILENEVLKAHLAYIEELVPNPAAIRKEEVDELTIRHYRFTDKRVEYQMDAVFWKEELLDILTSEIDYKEVAKGRVLRKSIFNQRACDMNEFLRIESEKLGISDELVRLYQQLERHKVVTVTFSFKGNELTAKMDAGILANKIRNGWYISEYVFEGSKEKAKEMIKSIGASYYLEEGNNLLLEHIVKVTHRHNVLFDTNSVK